MTANKQNTLWFSEVNINSLIEYQIEVETAGVQIGEAQVIPKEDALDGYDKVAGEMELRLGTITALGDDANGIYDFHIYSVNGNGRSETPLKIEGIEIDFLLPIAPTSGGVR